MRRLVQTLAKFLTPALILLCIALFIVLLAVVPGNKTGLLLAMLWAAATMAALRWSVWGILTLAKKRATPEELKILTRTAEVLMLILTVTALVFAILLRDIPPVWVFLPVPLFGLQGAIRFDAERL